MKTTVEIADPLFSQARAIAARENLSFRTLIEEGLHLAIEARESAVLKPFRLREGSFRGGRGLHPGIEWKDLASLAYEDSPVHKQE